MKVLNHHVPVSTLLVFVYEYLAVGASIYLAGLARFG